jgi:hypothetical protein
MGFLKEHMDLREKVTRGWEILINEFHNLYSSYCHVIVTGHGVWIGNRIYWTHGIIRVLLLVIDELYFSLQHMLSLHQSLPGNGFQRCPMLPRSRLYRLATVSQLIYCSNCWTSTNFKVKVTSRQTDSRLVSLAVKPHLGSTTRFLLLSDSYSFVDVGRTLWREDGSVIYRRLTCPVGSG